MVIHYETVDQAPAARLRPFSSKEAKENDFIVDKGDLGLNWGKIYNAVIYGKSVYRFNRANIIHSIYDGTYYYKYKGMGDLEHVFSMKGSKKHGAYTSYATSACKNLLHGGMEIKTPVFSVRSAFKEDSDEEEDEFKPVIAMGKYNTGRKEAKWYKFYPNGNIKEECFYRLGKLDGYKAIYEENNIKTYDGFFNTGKAVGEHDYYIDGELVTREIRHGASKYRKYSYRFGKSASVIDYKIIDTFDTVEHLDKVNNKVSTKQVPVKRHVKDGKFVIYHPNSKKRMEGQYISDCFHGVITTYHINGLLHTQCTYLNNLRNGPFKEMMFAADGKTEKIKIEGRYANGRRVGAWKFHGDKTYTESY